MEISNNYFSINKLATFSRTTRATLLHYESLGILLPAFVDQKKFRYYSYEQIGLVNHVRIMQILGMPLKEIAEIVQNRSTKDIMNMLESQLVVVNKTIAEQLEVRKLIMKFKSDLESVTDLNENEIKIHWEEKKNILLGPKNKYSKGTGNKKEKKASRMDYDALVKFYEYCETTAPEINISLNYSPWSFFSKERLEKGDWIRPDHYYLYTPEGRDEKPAGLYATGYTHGYYGYSHDGLYQRLMNYIDENDLEITGGAYEEYPLDEQSVRNPTNYLVRISILVKQKE